MVSVKLNVKIVLFFAFASGIASCDNVRDVYLDMHGRLSVTSKGYIAIPIDSVSLNFSTYPCYYQNDSVDYYIVGNEIINSIDFYDLNKQKLVRRNVYPKEGDNGILFTHKLFVKSLDSIYVYSDDDKRILLTNFQGEALQHYSIPDIRFIMTHLLAPFTVIGNDVFAAYMAFGDNRQQVGHKTMVKFNLKSGEFEEFGPPYPEVFSGNLYYNFIPYYTFGPDDNVIVQHGSLADLSNYSLAADTSIIFNMRSRLQHEDIVPDTIASEVMEMNNEFEELVQPNYAGVFYDKFSELYYSVYCDGIAIRNSDGLKNDFDDKPVSIVVFNRRFEYLGEIPLDINTYYRNFIPTRLGLLIPTSHPRNEDSKDDILQFEIFNICANVDQ